MTYFIGILDGAGEVWGVRVPDMPGCTAGGATATEAISNAVRAMVDWATETIAAGRTIPGPRDVDEIAKDTDEDFNPALERVVMLPFVFDSGGQVKATISINAAVLAAIDQAANARGITRSAFIAAAAKQVIERATV